MPKFTVNAFICVSLFKEIEATNELEALEIAASLETPSPAWNAYFVDRHTWDIEPSLDGEVQGMEIEKPYAR